MLFTFTCLDKKDGLALRLQTRPTHLEYLDGHKGRIVFGGPLLDDAGEKPIGSLLIVDLPDQVAAQTFANNDPYAKAGLFQSVTIRPVKKVFPEA